MNTPLPPQSPEEQKELARLYAAYWYISLPFVAVICALLIVLLLSKQFFPRGHPFRLTMDILLMAVGIPLFLIGERKKARWLRNLTEQDLALLKRAAESRAIGIMRGIAATIDPSKPARDILAAHRKLEVNAEKELLRASNPAHSSTTCRVSGANSSSSIVFIVEYSFRKVRDSR